MSEKEIIKGCLDNDRDCQKALYERFYGKMLGVCLRYSGGENEAHEMLQSGFLEVYRSIKSFKDNESLELWIKKIIIKASIKYIRSDKEKRLIVSTVHANKGTTKSKSVKLDDEEVIAKIQKDDILKAVQELTSGYRIVFNLFLIDGYTHKEIAEILDVSEDTSRVNFEKARFTFQQNLMQHLSN